jgi:D-hexose-6-phosphate mutarotase
VSDVTIRRVQVLFGHQKQQSQPHIGNIMRTHWKLDGNKRKNEKKILLMSEGNYAHF